MIRSDEPSGATAQSRAATSASGRSDLERQLDLGKAEDVERLLERFEREAHRTGVLRALVGRPVALTAVGTPRAGVAPVDSALLMLAGNSPGSDSSRASIDGEGHRPR